MTTRSRAKLEEEEAAASARPAKIRKTDVNFERHHTHWYSDGNVLLQTENTRYKVHQSRLADVCAFFRLFFSYYSTMNTAAYDNLDEEHQSFVDAILASEETEDNLPLFYLDSQPQGWSAPTPAQFSALLNFIYNGIHYAFNHPGIDEIVLLAGAAVIYEAKPLVEYVEKCLKIIFPRAKVLDLSPEPSVYVAIQGVLLARKHPHFDILPIALHDVARASAPAIQEFSSSPDNAQPVAPGDDEGVSETEPAAIVLKANNDSLAPDLSKNAKVAIVQGLSHDDMLLLQVFQKHLAKAWSDIEKDILALSFVPCKNTCNVSPTYILPILNKFHATRTKNLSDPIVGLRDLIKDSLLEPYCKACNTKLTQTLKSRRSELWKNICDKWIK